MNKKIKKIEKKNSVDKGDLKEIHGAIWHHPDWNEIIWWTTKNFFPLITPNCRLTKMLSENKLFHYKKIGGKNGIFDTYYTVHVYSF